MEETGGDTPALSVIVPSRNGGASLRSVVDALARQTLPRDRFEVVIADDGSTDGSAEGLATEDGWLRVSRGPAQGSYAARNRAVAAARADILAFCDADCVPETDWLEAGLATIEAGADLAAGLVRFLVPRRPTTWTILDIDLFLDQERAVAAGRATTANLFVRTSLFDRIGGFDDSLPSGGDYDFVARGVAAGGRLVLSPVAVVWHPTRDTASAVLRKLWRTQRSYGARLGRAGDMPSGLLSLVPLVQPVRSRRRSGTSLRPSRRRLADSGIHPTRAEELRCLLALYGVIPYVSALAQFRGWVEGRRARTSEGRR